MHSSYMYMYTVPTVKEGIKLQHYCLQNSIFLSQMVRPYLQRANSLNRRSRKHLSYQNRWVNLLRNPPPSLHSLRKASQQPVVRSWTKTRQTRQRNPKNRFQGIKSPEQRQYRLKAPRQQRRRLTSYELTYQSHSLYATPTHNRQTYQTD